jgi:hypothetical protein
VGKASDPESTGRRIRGKMKSVRGKIYGKK